MKKSEIIIFLNRLINEFPSIAQIHWDLLLMVIFSNLAL